VSGSLQREALVVDEPACSSEAMQTAFLQPVGSEGEPVRLVPLHNLSVRSMLARRYLQEHALNQIALAAKSGQQVELECYCAPHACHADVLAQVIAERLNQRPATG